jgi:PII-like signaling protein
MITAVDKEEKIREILPVLDEMVSEGLVALSDVEVIKYAHTHRELEASPTPHSRAID